MVRQGRGAHGSRLQFSSDGPTDEVLWTGDEGIQQPNDVTNRVLICISNMMRRDMSVCSAGRVAWPLEMHILQKVASCGQLFFAVDV